MLTLEWGERSQTPCALLLGGFDGLHKGHETLLRAAKNTGLPVAVTAIYGCKEGGDVFTKREREIIFERAGAECVLHISFSRVKDLPAREFLNVLFEKINAQAIFCGEDFRFGYGAQGSAQTLREFAPCPVTVLPAVCRNGKKISISEGKEYLKKGDVASLNGLLVQPYFIAGEVERGRQVGRTLAFPTANLSFPAEKFPLREGVYAGYVKTRGGTFQAIVNTGARPTFGLEERKVEAHLLHFQGDLYGETVEVYPAVFLRDIVRFDSAEQLCEQLKQDIKRAGDLL